MSTARADRLPRADLRPRGIPAQADELPAPYPDLRRPAAELSRAAGAAGGVRHGLSLRAVGRALGADPGPRVHPGRRPPVLHPRAGARRVPVDDGDDPVLSRTRAWGCPTTACGSPRATRTIPSTRGPPATSGGAPRTISARSSTRWACPTKRRPARRRFTVPRPISSSGTASAGQWQLGTVQLDYVLPERFGLEYIGPDNQPHRPVMIHRAPLGQHGAVHGHPDRALRRGVSALAGPRAGARAADLRQGRRLRPAGAGATARAAGFRATLDLRPEKIGAKIRDAQLEKIPAMLVVGAKEAENQAVSYRDRIAGDLGAMPLARRSPGSSPRPTPAPSPQRPRPRPQPTP